MFGCFDRKSQLGVERDTERIVFANSVLRALPGRTFHFHRGTMRKGIAGVLALFGLVAFAPGGVKADGSISSGKTTVAATQSGLALDTSPTLSLTIEKGKKKRVLLVTGTAFTNFSSGSISVSVQANGLPMGPASSIVQRCNSAACAVSGTFWLDIDAAEAANPGVFANLPVNVVGTFSANAVTSGNASLTATLVKK
jgi:hypothetical protein